MDNQVYVMTDTDGCVEAVYRNRSEAQWVMLGKLIDNYKDMLRAGDTHRFIGAGMNPNDSAIDELDAITQELDTLYTNYYIDDFLYLESAELR